MEGPSSSIRSVGTWVRTSGPAHRGERRGGASPGAERPKIDVPPLSGVNNALDTGGLEV